MKKPPTYIFNRDGITGPVPDPPKKSWSERQVAHLSRFELAKEFGRRVVADPALSELYRLRLKQWKKKKSRNVGVYQMAIRDFMHPPSIPDIRFDRSVQGPVGVKIEAVAHTNITSVWVKVVLPDGRILEEGEASKPGPGIYYHYCLRYPSLLKPGVTCRVSVRDIPGNVTEKEVAFSL
ncbi:MAG: hypothetical protein WCK34_03320 [Bacteroidota bacterium]